MSAAGAVAHGRREGAPLAVASRALPDDVDALALFRARPDPTRFFFERPDRGESIAAVGAAERVVTRGAARFADLGAALADLGTDGTAPPVVVGGFAYDPEHVASGTWEGFGPVDFVVPALALVRRGGHARLTATGPDATRMLDETCAALTAVRSTALPVDERAAYEVAALEPPGTYRDGVEAALATMAAGGLAKVVLARRAVVTARTPFDPWRVVERLRAEHPAAVVFAVGRGARTFVGATPELLARVDGRFVTTAAVAGTVVAGGGHAADARRAAALQASDKERREHALVVGELGARLGPLCESLHVPDRPEVLRASVVQHLHTPIRGRLAVGRGLTDVLTALHPSPAVCGLPREAARHAIASAEAGPRGWYSGGVGWIGPEGGEVVVAIRSALLTGTRATLFAGSGIVPGSTWEAELAETTLKMRPILHALMEL